MNLFNVARVVIGVALGLVTFRCIIHVFDWRKTNTQRLLFAALAVAGASYIIRFGELWNDPVTLSSLPLALLFLILILLACKSRWLDSKD